MKKNCVFFIFICVLLLGVFLGGCTPKNEDDISNENIDSVEAYNKRVDLLIQNNFFIMYSSEKVENEKDKYYLYFGRNDCSFCQEFLPELEDLVNKTEVKLYYVDTNIKNEQLEELLSEFNVEYVPTLIKMEKEKSIMFDFTEDELDVFID